MPEKIEAACADLDLRIFVIAKHPLPADRTVTGEWNREQIGQAPASPQPILVDRITPQRVKSLLVHRLHALRATVSKLFLS